LWTKPQQLRLVTIAPHEQTHQDVFVDSAEVQPELIECSLLYGSTIETLLLPNLVTQYLVYDAIKPDLFKRKWQQRLPSIYRSDQFKYDPLLLGSGTVRI
jgi:hypothetical protein